MPICGTPAVPVCRAVPIREHRACGYKRKSRAAMARDFSVGNSGLSLSGRTQDAFAFVHVELLQLVAGRAQVFAGVELCGLVYEDLADGCGHRQTAVRVDVDLADCALGGAAKLLFGNTYGILERTAVRVDDLHVFLRYGRRAVQHDREAWQTLGHFLKNVEPELRLRAGLELIGAVARADCDCE